MSELDPDDLRVFADATLAEDVGQGDVTANATIPETTELRAVFETRQDCVVAGVPVAVEILRRLDPAVAIDIRLNDGARARAGDVILTAAGNGRALLTAERSALNILQFLSGIATLTRAYVDRIAGTGAVLLDTRKTIPGLRVLSKYAVRMGGGQNHRMRLDDGVLIKDNHIAIAGSLTAAVAAAKAATDLQIQVECDTLDQVREALAAGAERLLLDNMNNDTLRQAVAIVGGRVPLEASGGVNLDTIRGIAETGVNYISVGRLTQSAPAIDIGLDYAG